jgi:hypothetical protein
MLSFFIGIRQKKVNYKVLIHLNPIFHIFMERILSTT